MDLQDAEKMYRDLKHQHDAKKLSDAEFEAKVAKLRHQDAQGRWWQLNAATGEWLPDAGQKQDEVSPPPAPTMPTAAPLPVSASAAAEGSAAHVAMPPPPDAGATAGGGAAQESTGAGVPPARRRRGASAGKGNGLPVRLLIGIIAVVAVVAILALLGGYLLLSGALGGSATVRVTTTPTRSLALVPSPVIPTLTQAAPTNTPLPPPTIAVTATETVTPTRAVVKATATKKPASTPVGPTATKLPSVPPGVYVTGIETVPAGAGIGSVIGFKVSFLNTTGSVQSYNWYVKVYQCPDQCTDFKHSYGETLHLTNNVATGSSALTTSQTINLGPGLRCDLIAVATYIDPVNQAVTAFQATKNNGYFSFSVCH